MYTGMGLYCGVGTGLYHFRAGDDDIDVQIDLFESGDYGRLNKHFLIAESPQHLPEGWQESESSGWWIGRGPDLRHHPLQRKDGTEAGIVLGWVVDENGLLPDGAKLHGPERGQDIAAWSSDVMGRFICLIGAEGEATRLILDASGLLGTVFDPARRAIASIPALLPGENRPDEALQAEFGIPERRGWYPFGLTPARRPEADAELCAEAR